MKQYQAVTPILSFTAIHRDPPAKLKVRLMQGIQSDNIPRQIEPENSSNVFTLLKYVLPTVASLVLILGAFLFYALSTRHISSAELDSQLLATPESLNRGSTFPVDGSATGAPFEQDSIQKKLTRMSFENVTSPI